MLAVFIAAEPTASSDSFQCIAGLSSPFAPSSFLYPSFGPRMPVPSNSEGFCSALLMAYTAHFGLHYVWVRIGYPGQQLHSSRIFNVMHFCPPPTQKCLSWIIGLHRLLNLRPLVKSEEHKSTKTHTHRASHKWQWKFCLAPFLGECYL